MKETFHEVEAALKAASSFAFFLKATPHVMAIFCRFVAGSSKWHKSTALPIVPVYLDQVWGSCFSYKHGKMFWKWSDRGGYPVSITLASHYPIRPRPRKSGKSFKNSPPTRRRSGREPACRCTANSCAPRPVIHFARA